MNSKPPSCVLFHTCQNPHVVPKHRRGLSGVFDEPSGFPPSNEDTDNFDTDPIFAEISGIKTHASTTPDPLRKTARTTIAKPTPKSLTKAAKKTPTVIRSKTAVQDSEDQAE